MPKSKPKNSTSPEITEVLHQDHQKVRELFFKFEETEDDKEKESIVKEILTELYVHSTVEEEIVYPVVETKAEEGGEIVDEAEIEHRVVKFMMAELSKMSAGDDQFDAKVTVLAELVSHHIEEEEKQMFKKLHESEADLEELAEKAQERKEELQGEPLPSMESTLSIGDEGAEKSEKSASARRKQKTTRATKRRKTA